LAFSELTVREFLAALGSSRAAPSGGGAAAIACALAAGLVEMTARLSPGNEAVAERAELARTAVEELPDTDAAAYAAVLAARDAAERSAALSRAADVPLAIAREAASVAELAAALVETGNPRLRGDALTGVLLAEAAALAAARLVEINLADTAEDERVGQAREAAALAAAARARVTTPQRTDPGR
jgi:formiminotetrahydrofolate cyclodeaminase